MFLSRFVSIVGGYESTAVNVRLNESEIVAGTLGPADPAVIDIKEHIVAHYGVGAL
jgi:hypothetical protein